MTAPLIGAPRALTGAGDLRPAERAAVILSLMEPDEARALASAWTPSEVDRVIAAYEALGRLPRPVVLDVIASFVAEVASPHPTVRGGYKQASALAQAILPEPQAQEAQDSETAVADIGEDASPEAVWAHVGGLQPDALADLMRNERPSVTAAVVAQIGEAKGAGLLAALPEERAVAVAAILADGRRLAPSTIDAIAEALRGQAAAGAATPEPEDGASLVTALLNRCPFTRQEAILAPLRAEAPEVAAKVEAGLLRYATLAARLPRTAAPALFREADQDMLDTALRYGAETDAQATDFLYSNISQRLAEQIRERVAERPMPDQAAGEAAQAALIGTLIGWVEEGRFALVAPEAAADA